MKGGFVVNKNIKLTHLEGMRALMAINVLLCHFVCAYYPQMYFLGNRYEGPLTLFATSPLSVLVNGNIAVVFFFALTGFLVGRSVFIKNATANDIFNKAFNRYVRLLPIVVISTFFTFITMKFGLQSHLDIVNENVNINFLSEYCNFDATIINLISNSFFNPFITNSAYIGPFWTIKYEFWGYIVVFILALSLKESRLRRIGYIVTAIIFGLCLDTYYSIFVLGLFVADLEFNRTPAIFDKYYSKLLTNKIFVLCCFFASTYFSCCPLYENNPLYAFWFKIPVVHSNLLRGLGMAMFIYVCMHSGVLQKVLSFKPLTFLGEMSFETYAIHWPLMLTCQAALFLNFEKHFKYDIAALLAFVITVIVIYIASFVLNIIVKKINKAISYLQSKCIYKLTV